MSAATQSATACATQPLPGRGRGRRPQLAGGGGGAGGARARPPQGAPRRGGRAPAGARGRAARARASPPRCPRRAPPWATGSATASPTRAPVRDARLRRRFPGAAPCSRSRARGAYAIRPDGSTRRLGAFSEAGWSPHGLHVVGVAGRRLVAVDPAGTVKWTLTAPAACSHPAWSTGARLRGRLPRGPRRCGWWPATATRPPTACCAATPRRSRPPGARTATASSTYATTAGALETVDVADRRARCGTRAGRRARGARALAWSRGRPAARRALGHARSRSWTPSGRVLRTIPLPGVAPAQLALHPSGQRAAAVVVGEAGVLGVLGCRSAAGTPRQLFQGDVDGIAWSRTAAGCCSAGATPTSGSCSAPAAASQRAARRERRARRRGRLPARGRLVLRRLARRPLLDLDHLLERRPVDPVDQRLVDRSDRPLAHRVVAPLVRRHLVVLAGLVLVEGARVLRSAPASARRAAATGTSAACPGASSSRRSTPARAARAPAGRAAVRRSFCA